MHPVLLKLGPVTIYSYGFFIAAAFLAGLGWTTRETRAKGLRSELVSDFGFYIILGAILGSRILYVLINPTYFLNHPLEIFQFWKGGLVFSGGFIVAVLLGYRYLRSKQEPIFKWMDACAPGLALGQAIGRIGCMAAGCCYGAKCDLPWAVVFSNTDSLAPLFTPLHPTQLYHSLAGLFNFILLLLLKPRLKNDGQVMGVFLILFASFRVLIEFFRSDYRGQIGVFSVTQLIAGVAFILGLYLVFKRSKNV